jgi:putative metallohydrolase (TIGR04338 family)
MAGTSKRASTEDPYELCIGKRLHNVPGKDCWLTKLQQRAYDAQMAADLPVSHLGTQILIARKGVVGIENCARYIAAVQEMARFKAAFRSHDDPVIVIGGRGISHADAQHRTIKIGTTDRQSVPQCERACLHELAHIVSSDTGPDGHLREPRLGRYSSKGHHDAWRVNFVLIVRMVVGKHAATRLRQEFNMWGLPTQK